MSKGSGGGALEDYSNFTVPELKSLISERGFTDKLPTSQKPKEVYLRIFKEYIVPLLQKEAREEQREIHSKNVMAVNYYYYSKPNL